MLGLCAGAQPLPAVAIYRHSASPWPRAIVNALRKKLLRDGDVTILNDEQIAQLQPGSFRLLILCDSQTLPARAVDPIVHFVRAGGDIMALGGPAFSNPQWHRDGKWITKADYLRMLASSKTGAPLFDLKNAASWTHSSSQEDSGSKISIDADAALRMDFVGYDNWENFSSPAINPNAARANHHDALTCFRARGSPGTSQLAVEWRETDGSRWIATIALSPKWQNYFLPPSVFAFWSRGNNRGGSGDVLHIQNASVLSFGLSESHTVCVRDGNHTAWVSDIKFTPPPDNLPPTIPLLLAPETVPSLELISPYYRIYPVTNLDHLAVNLRQVIAGPIDGPIPKPAKLYACDARPQGTGIDKHRSYRTIPLLQCIDAQGRACGAAAAMAIQDGISHGSINIAVPIADANFFSDEKVQNWLAALARRTLDGVFLYEGGTQYYVGFPGESMKIGGSYINRGQHAENVLLSLLCDGKPASNAKLGPANLAPGHRGAASTTFVLPDHTDKTITVSILLQANGKVIDRLDHELRVWQDNPHPDFITAHDGHFYLDGKRWRAHGINYMPTSGIGAQNFNYFQFWLDPGPYDPDVIQRDLDDIQSMGINAISVFISPRSLESRNLFDLLMRCKEHGLKVNLAIPSSPMNFPWNEDRTIIQQMRLANNDTIFAYDIAWEPRWQGYGGRCQYDGDWQDWVKKHYGNAVKASAAWSFPTPMRDGHLTGPSDEQVAHDGPWRKMVLDYRRFQNDLLALRYGHARDLIHSIDPNHLLSFRMSMAGDPTYAVADMTYDFAGVARAVDFLAPEGYGRIGDENRVRVGDFTVAYGRAIAPKLPVIWAEFGVSVWNIGLHGDDPTQMRFAGDFYNNFYRMIRESDADGSFPWWLAGGYRFNERSDYGVINPDRSWRPQAIAIHHWASTLDQPQPAKPSVQIPIQLNHYVDGLHGTFEHVRQQFFAALDAGKQPVLLPSSSPHP